MLWYEFWIIKFTCSHCDRKVGDFGWKSIEFRKNGPIESRQKSLQSLQVRWVKKKWPKRSQSSHQSTFSGIGFSTSQVKFSYSVCFFHELHLISVVFSPTRSNFHELHRELLSPSPLPIAFLRKEAYNSTGRRLRPGESTERESYRYPNEPISQVGKRRLIFKNALVGDMLLSRRVMVIPKFNQFVEA